MKNRFGCKKVRIANKKVGFGCKKGGIGYKKVGIGYKKVGLGYVDAQDSTPLLAAASKGFTDVVCLLLDKHVHGSAYINVALPSGKVAANPVAKIGQNSSKTQTVH